MVQKENTEKNIHQREMHLVSFLIFLFILLSIRLFYLQIIRHNYYKEQAFQQHWKKQILPARRGCIYDRNGNVLALSIPAFSCHANPKLVKNPEETAKILASILNLSIEKVLSLITHPTRRFVWIKRKITNEEKESVEKEKLPGIAFTEESKRVYPNKSLAAHIIGFCDMDQRGLEGIEASFQEELSGKDGLQWTLKDGRTKQHRIHLPEAPYLQASHGGDVYLNIDIHQQAIVEQELDNVMKKQEAKGAACVLLDVKTAEVLALASRPTFDPNDYKNVPRENLRNKAISDAFELGSVMKPFVVSAGLAEKKITVDTMIDCGPGYCKIIPGRVLHDSHKIGVVPVTEVLKQSSNIGSAKIGMMLGKEKLYQYLTNLGFGKKTDIEISGESIGILKNVQRWTDFSMTSIPMGHEICVTPLQMVTAYVTIAGDGIYRKPSLVRKIQYHDGTILYKDMTDSSHFVFDSSLVKKMCEILRSVVTDGTAKQANIKDLAIAGKTGTAQKLDSHGKYVHNKHVATFVGFAPADNPILCTLVMVDEPKHGSYGGTVSGPVVANILRSCYYYAIAR